VSIFDDKKHGSVTRSIGERIQSCERNQEDVWCRSLADADGYREGLTLALGERADLVVQGTEETVQPGVWHLSLERRSRRGEHRHTQFIRSSLCLAEQSRLPDARVAPDEKRSSWDTGLLDNLAQNRELAVATEQLGGVGRGCEPRVMFDRR
jgi:hypothetical protein